MNQSELEANAPCRNQARENMCEQVMIDFGLTSDRKPTQKIELTGKLKRLYRQFLFSLYIVYGSKVKVLL